ncbi:calcium-translocating P-type ATPase, SERCA-type [Candidatus Woesearchaeota archaeon]|nr:calcium-translocating P-type ATPase, SERCA-type [Candidatus Woesearchaeota archaeon]
MWHTLQTYEALHQLRTTEQGLTKTEAGKRLLEGKNEITHEKKQKAITIFLNQFKSSLVIILIIATLISYSIHEKTSAYTITAIILLNSIIGFFQEYKAEKAIENLKKQLAPKATVKRDGKIQEIPAEELVPGDIILVESGTNIAADARILTAMHLQTQEASLTGESTPVEKNTKPTTKNTTIAEQQCMIFAGTSITQGRAEAVVVNTGMDTQLGNIAKLLQETKHEKTPLEKQVTKTARTLTIIVIVIAIIILLNGILTGKQVFESMLFSVALAVAAIPEGLPAVVTMTLAIAIQRMAKKNALIRKIPSVETLGACSVICTDKTGTLTHNQMTVKKIYVNNTDIDVSGSGYDEQGGFTKKSKELETVLKIGALANNAKLYSENNQTKIVGDPTEGALLISAKKAGIDYEELRRKYPRKDEIEFTSERKMMSALHIIEATTMWYSKGAPEVIIKECDKMLINNRTINLTPERKKEILAKAEEYGKEALRVLAFAYGKTEEKMTFVGIQAMIDPPRSECREAIRKCLSAGIKVIMITGDQISTAIATAKKLGLKGKAISGKDINPHLENVEEITVFARTEPRQKLDIVHALKHKGHIVAMTGDGINDAPALKKADIGIAVGTGTDVAKDASHMILTDDNFASIVSAIEEGRRVFDNIRKFATYLLSSNLGEILTIFLSIILKMQMPITALQILWINLVTDGAPALALGAEKPEPKIMEQKPRKPEEGIITKKNITTTLLIAALMAAGTLTIFSLSDPEFEINYARTMAFNTLVMFQLFNTLNQRSEKNSIFLLHKNPWIWIAITTSIFLQAAAIYSPLNKIFLTTPLTAIDWLWSIGFASTVLALGELIKYLKR